MLFHYPNNVHQRKHGPHGYKEYGSFKPWLRDEFAFRCVYCLWRERWCSDGDAYFGVDHLQPQSTAPQLIGDYANLVYSCGQCNSFKQDQKAVLSPCQDAMGRHLEVQADGQVRAISERGMEQIMVCRLNRAKLVEARRMMIELFDLVQDDPSPQASTLRRHIEGFPENLPQLSKLRPPGGNGRPEGVGESFWEQRRRNELPERS